MPVLFSLPDWHRSRHHEFGRRLHRHAGRRRRRRRAFTSSSAQVVGAGGGPREFRALLRSSISRRKRNCSAGGVDLPWESSQPQVAGVLGSRPGRLVPGRQVSSAKSWLCQPAVDRTADILPGEAEPPQPGFLRSRRPRAISCTSQRMELAWLRDRGLTEQLVSRISRLF